MSKNVPVLTSELFVSFEGSSMHPSSSGVSALISGFVMTFAMASRFGGDVRERRLAKFRQNVARFRLYRLRFLQENMRFAAFFKIYQIFKLKFLKFGKTSRMSAAAASAAAAA